MWWNFDLNHFCYFVFCSWWLQIWMLYKPEQLSLMLFIQTLATTVIGLCQLGFIYCFLDLRFRNSQNFYVLQFVRFFYCHTYGILISILIVILYILLCSLFCCNILFYCFRFNRKLVFIIWFDPHGCCNVLNRSRRCYWFDFEVFLFVYLRAL